MLLISLAECSTPYWRILVLFCGTTDALYLTSDDVCSRLSSQCFHHLCVMDSSDSSLSATPVDLKASSVPVYLKVLFMSYKF